MEVKVKGLLKTAAVLFGLCIAGTAQSTDITVFVISDTHFINKSLPKYDKAGIQAMNGLPGVSYPASIGGTVAYPWAVISCGDLCDGGAGLPASDTPKWYTSRNYQDQWYGYDYYFPKNGVTGDINRLKYPNYATAGNHDYYNNFGQILSSKSYYVTNKLKARYGLTCNSTNGNVYYSFDMDGVHFCSLGRWTDDYVLGWLANDLAATGSATPVVLFLHYAFNDGELWYTNAERQRLANVINGYNVIAILHGHTHDTGHYTWNGYDIYDDGTLGKNGEFGVMRITDNTLTFAEYQTYSDSNGNWTGGYWQWSHTKQH